MTLLGCCPKRTEPQWRLSVATLLLLLSMLSSRGVDSFQPVLLLPTASQFRTTAANSVRIPNAREDSSVKEKLSSSTSLNMFMGSDGGLLGVGGPEIFTILLVGYFVLGPSELYKLVKEIGKFIQNIRTLGTDLSTTFENNMESTLQLDELRKAQRELNDAFSFRRSINVDADSEAFSVQAGSAQEAEAAVAAGTVVTAVESASQTDPNNVKPKKIRRRVRRTVIEEPVAVPSAPAVVNNVPDLAMPESAFAASIGSKNGGISAEEAAEIEDEFDQYVADDPSSLPSFSGPGDWYNEQKTAKSSTKVGSIDPASEKGAQSRFQQQLSGNWNDQILAVGDDLEPMALVMNKIALLEQEKIAAVRRLEEEFAKRTEIEEKYYREQRKLLEEAATEVQNVAFGLDSKSKI